MTIETALYPSQLNAALPPQSDIVREGAGHLRLLKTVVKTTFPNLGGAWNATQTEANCIVGVTSPIQAQINSKGAIAGQTWTGAHVFSGTAAVPTLAQGTNTTGAASTAFVQAEWATRLPNYTAPITANSTELNRLVGVTSGVQSQINAKGAIAGQTWTGTHSFPNTTTVGPLTPTIQGRLSTVTSDVQAQINSKASKAGDTYTGAHNYTGATVTVQTLAPGSSGNSAASVDYVNSSAFAAALPSQTGNAGGYVSTDGVTASWRNFFGDVRAATLTGLSTATSAAVAATDTVLAAIGKLQAQVSTKFDKTGGDVDGNINISSGAALTFGDQLRVGQTATFTSLPNATDWLRLCTFNSDNQPRYVRFLLSSDAHDNWLVEFSPGAGGDNIRAKVILLGVYVYFSSYPLQWRIVSEGVNAPSHIDIKFGGNNAPYGYMITALESHSTSGTSTMATFPCTNVGTSVNGGAGTSYGIQLGTPSGFSYREVELVPGYYARVGANLARSNGTIAANTVVA